MEIRVVGDRSKVIQELFSGFYSVNRKAKMVSHQMSRIVCARVACRIAALRTLVFFSLCRG